MTSSKRAQGLQALEGFGTEPQTVEEPAVEGQGSTPQQLLPTTPAVQPSATTRGRGRPKKRKYPEGMEIIPTSTYIPEPAHDKLREYVFHHKGVSINDCILEGIDLFFKRHGIPTAKQLIDQQSS